MEKNELLEKLVEVQEMHIELMQNYNDLEDRFKDLAEMKNKSIENLKININEQEEKIARLIKENNELKQQYEELLNSLVKIEIADEDMPEEL